MIDPKAAKIIEMIEKVFTDVSRGEIGLHAASALDDNAGDVEYREAGKLDTYERWQDIPDAWIERFTCSLMWMDPISWRGHIAAYMTWSLQNHKTTETASSEMTIESLSPRRYYMFSKCDLLDEMNASPGDNKALSDRELLSAIFDRLAMDDQESWDHEFDRINDHWIECVAILSETQRAACAHYMEYMSIHDTFRMARNARRAVLEYWRTYSEIYRLG
jgi:hypothetical protein